MAEKGGNWLALPYGDPRKDQLEELFEHDGIPHLVLVNGAGEVLNKNARGVIGKDPKADSFPWLPEAIMDMSEPEDVNEFTSVLIFAETMARLVRRLSKASKMAVRS